MKFFSNFDTTLKKRELENAIKEYGKEKVLLIGKSRLFKLEFVLFPLFLLLSFAVGFSYLVYFGLGLSDKATLYIVGPILLIVLLFSSIPIIKKYIDYNMDFMIVTPRLIIKYNQEGLLKRDFFTTYMIDIKSVVVRKKGLLYSIFDVGDLIFLSEGDQEKTELTLQFVSDPELKRNMIIAIKNLEETESVQNT